jgi:hypothetical protein
MPYLFILGMIIHTVGSSDYVALRYTEPPVLWILRAFSLAVKGPDYEAITHFCLASKSRMCVLSYISTSPHIFVLWYL